MKIPPASTKARGAKKRRQGFVVVDADSHVFEPAAIWTDYLARDYRVPARSAFWYEEADGITTVILNGLPAKPLTLSKINRQAIWRPGMTPEHIGGLDPTVPHPINPGAANPKARLRDMDALGVDRAVLFPTLFAEYFPAIENPDVAAALARAYNDWLWDFSRVAPKRLVPVAVLPLQDVNFSLRELRRVAKRGFRAVFLRPAFYARRFGSWAPYDVATRPRFLNHPDYDPLWSALEAHGVVACIHPSPGSTNAEWTSTGAYLERVAQALRTGHYLAESVAPTMDNAIFLTAVCFYAHLERFPKLRFSMHHAGASWVPLALEKAETYLWLLSNFKDVSLEPERVFFKRPPLVTFNTWESSVARLPETFGAIAAWGSRYPHHDASGPEEAIENLRKWELSEDTLANYMGGNAGRYFASAAER